MKFILNHPPNGILVAAVAILIAVLTGCMSQPDLTGVYQVVDHTPWKIEVDGKKNTYEFLRVIHAKYYSGVKLYGKFEYLGESHTHYIIKCTTADHDTYVFFKLPKDKACGIEMSLDNINYTKSGCQLCEWIYPVEIQTGRQILYHIGLQSQDADKTDR